MQVQIFDSIGSEQHITTVTTPNDVRAISILFSHDHYDSLVPISEEDIEIVKNHEILSSEFKVKITSHLRKLEREDEFANEYPTNHTENNLESFMEYLKTNKLPENIEELKNKKNKLNCSEVVSFKDKKDAKKEFESAKRHFRGIVQKRYKI